MTHKFKKNHIVPEALLHRFKNDKKEFFYANKSRADEPIVHRNPSGVFYGNNIYVSQDADGNRDVSLESEKFKGIEDRAKPAIDRIIAAARLGKTPNLTSVERMAWDEFFTNQQIRTPEFYETIPLMGLSSDLLESATVQGDEIDSNALKRITEPLAISDFKRWHQKLKVDVLAKPTPKASEEIASRGIIIYVPESQDDSFIIGSQPIAWMKLAPQLYFEYAKMALLPISYDVAVGVGSKGENEVLYKLSLGAMCEVNEVIYANSIEVGSRSKTLLMSLRNPR